MRMKHGLKVFVSYLGNFGDKFVQWGLLCSLANRCPGAAGGQHAG